MNEASLAPELLSQSFCYLTTTGRVTGRPHEIEIWFAARGSTIYMLSGGGERSDWVRNLMAQPEVMVRIKDRHFVGAARLVDEAREDSMARDLVAHKYQPGYSGDLGSWKVRALPIAVDVRPS